MDFLENSTFTGSGKVESSAPLIPFLRRLEAIEPQREFATLNEDHDNVENNADINDNDNENENEPFVSATEAFLRYLEYPEDETFNVDLQQCAVIIMSHLDRLASPIQPKLDSANFDLNSDRKPQQSLIWGGQVSWNMFMDYSVGDEGTFGVASIFGNIKVMQIAATSKGRLFLKVKLSFGISTTFEFSRQKLASKFLKMEHFKVFQIQND